MSREATGSAAVAIGRVGFVARGVVYLLVGWLALMTAVGVRASGVTDKQGSLQAVAEQPLGTVLLIFVSAGLMAYAAWSVVRAVFDPERNGTTAGGVIARVGYIVAGVSYAGLGIGALKVALGIQAEVKSSDASTQDSTARLLQTPFGPPLVIGVGLIVLGVAAVEFTAAYRASFKDKMDLAQLGPDGRKWVERAGRAGLAARGIVFGLTGIFLVQAARQDDPSQAIGLSGALQKLAEQSQGTLLLGAVALGLCMYGLFSFAEARYRRLKQA